MDTWGSGFVSIIIYSSTNGNPNPILLGRFIVTNETVARNIATHNGSLFVTHG